MLKPLIPDYALCNFQINERDDNATRARKQYWLDKNKIHRELYSQQQHDDLNDKYNKLMKMKRKTNIEDLRFQLALSELLDE
jgi:hypothetical protein